MDFVIVTGMSGAGKSNALNALEDIGFYCVDNLPPPLLETFYDICANSSDTRMEKVAVVADARSGNMFTDLSDVINHAKLSGKKFHILYLDAKLDVLLIRYKETRRKHPLSRTLVSGSVEDAVALEYEMMKGVKEMADFVINTSYMDLKQLKERVVTMFTSEHEGSLMVTFISFGFKYGIPPEADLLFDVRCLPNPFYINELKPLTGLDESVREYVMSFDDTHEFLKRVTDFLAFTVPLYRYEGKSELVVGIGCTGGKHRSVTIAKYLHTYMVDRQQKSSIHHRDIGKL